jgi:hypothetical protein
VSTENNPGRLQEEAIQCSPEGFKVRAKEFRFFLIKKQL